MIYVIHNDTYKYLFLDNNPEEKDNFYCIKEPEPLFIIHKDRQIGRDFFKVNDIIILSRKDGYQCEFKIGNTYSGNDEIIDDKSIFMIQYNRNGKMMYLYNCYENKDKKSIIYLLIFKTLEVMNLFFILKK